MHDLTHFFCRRSAFLDYCCWKYLVKKDLPSPAYRTGCLVVQRLACALITSCGVHACSLPHPAVHCRELKVLVRAVMSDVDGLKVLLPTKCFPECPAGTAHMVYVDVWLAYGMVYVKVLTLGTYGIESLQVIVFCVARAFHEFA